MRSPEPSLRLTFSKKGAPGMKVEALATYLPTSRVEVIADCNKGFPVVRLEIPLEYVDIGQEE